MDCFLPIPTSFICRIQLLHHSMLAPLLTVNASLLYLVCVPDGISRNMSAALSSFNRGARARTRRPHNDSIPSRFLPLSDVDRAKNRSNSDQEFKCVVRVCHSSPSPPLSPHLSSDGGNHDISQEYSPFFQGFFFSMLAKYTLRSNLETLEKPLVNL